MTVRFWLMLLLLASSCAGGWRPAEGWSGNTHRKLVSDALQRMPSRFLARFGPLKRDLMKGSTFPDSNLRDFQNHVFHVGSSRPQAAPAFCRTTFQELVHAARNRIADPDLAFRLGVFAHYLADWNQPLHTAGSELDPNEGEYHMPFERDVECLLSTIPPGQLKPSTLTDPVRRLSEMATAAHADYAAIGIAYRRGNKIFALKDIVARRYQASVQTIVDFWTAIFLEAGEPALIEELPVPESFSSLPGAVRSVAITEPVDLNRATFEQLMELPAVGPAKARAIIAARPFRSPYDLARVKGFGARSVERLLPLIRITPENRLQQKEQVK